MRLLFLLRGRDQSEFFSPYQRFYITVKEIIDSSVCERQTDSMKFETWNDESSSLETSGTFISNVNLLI